MRAPPKCKRQSSVLKLKLIVTQIKKTQFHFGLNVVHQISIMKVAQVAMMSEVHISFHRLAKTD